jgi:hypothetical protein
VLYDDDYPTARKPRKPQTRLWGGLLFVLGLTANYWATWLPLQMVQLHKTPVNYSNSGQLVASVVTLGGLSLLILGNSIRLDRNHFSQRLNQRLWFLVMVVLASGFVVNQWMKLELAKYGYTVK